MLTRERATGSRKVFMALFVSTFSRHAPERDTRMYAVCEHFLAIFTSEQFVTADAIRSRELEECAYFRVKQLGLACAAER